MKRALLALAACAALTGCANERPRQPLPYPARWFGTKILVPAGYARAVALSVCADGGQWGAWTVVTVPGGQELLNCENGVVEPYGSD